MGAVGFGHINLRAQRALLDQLYIFYTEVVGLTEGDRPPFQRFGYWLYLGNHDIVHLIEASPEEDRKTHVATVMDHFAFSCQNPDEFEQKLQLLRIPYKTAQIPLTGQLQFVLTDPAGNKVELNFPAR